MTFKQFLIAIVLVVLVVMVTACTDSDSLARVDGRDISRAEFEAYLAYKRIPLQDEQRVQRALDEYVRRAALVAAIENTERLDRQRLEAELEELRREMLISRYFDQYLHESVDDESVRNYYVNHAARYESRSVQAAHILLRLDNRMSEAERQAKLTAAHEAYSLIRAGGDFAEVAASHSEDRLSAERGGDLGWLREGAVDPEFSRRLFAMEVGEVSEPFLTPLGFHIVKVIEGPRTVTRPLEAVSGDIRYQLRNQAKLAETERLLESVRVSKKTAE